MVRKFQCFKRKVKHQNFYKQYVYYGFSGTQATGYASDFMMRLIPLGFK